MLMESGWVPMFAGKCTVAEMLSKQLSMLPSLSSVSGGVLLSVDTVQNGERSGKDRLGTGEGTEGLGHALGSA